MPPAPFEGTLNFPDAIESKAAPTLSGKCAFLRDRAQSGIITSGK